MTSIRNFQVLGPSQRAGFYRRSALLEVGGWDPRMGELHADIDLGCALALRGCICKVVPSCQVKMSGEDRVDTTGFVHGINAQRLVRRYPGLSDKRVHSTALVHATMVGLLNPKKASYLLGRLVGCAVGTKRRATEPATDAVRSPEENETRAA
jgi:hypothetical protein